VRPAHDWNQPCPNPACDYYKRMNWGNISAIASYRTQSGRRRVFRSLRVEIPAQERVSQGMIQPKWSQRTPAMAAELTEHVLAGTSSALTISV
jgi:hypothetical protein